MMALEAAVRTALIEFVWQGAVVALLAWITLALMRRRSANARYLVSCAALALLAALPVITAFAVFQEPVARASMAQFAAPLPQADGADWTSARSAISVLALLQHWALPIWFFGVGLFSVRLAWGARQVAMFRRSGAPADRPLIELAQSLAGRLGMKGPLRLLLSSEADGPSVVGWIRPVILLPAATLAGLTPEQLEAVLAHEIAHIRRHDYLVNLMQMGVETLLFYHPAVWWMSNRIRQERELCCDDVAVRVCGDALCYARALTRLERMRMLAPKMVMGSTGGSLLYRIQRLTGTATRRFAPSRVPGMLATALGLACLLAGLNWARLNAQSAKPQPPSKPPAAAPAATSPQESKPAPEEASSSKPRQEEVDSDDDDDNDNDADMDSDSDDDDDNDTDVDMPESAASEVENQLQEAESALEEAETELKDKFADLNSQMDEARRAFDQLQKDGKFTALNSVDGRTLRRIRVLGLSDASRTDLLKRLSLKEGDKLTQSVLQSLDKALKGFDSQLYFLAVPLEDGDAAVVIRKQ